MPWNAVANVFGTLMNNRNVDKQLYEQDYQNTLAFVRNKELAAIQNQYNIDQWNRENEYNTPLKQVARLKEAGLNPNLMYGLGTTGNATQLSGSLSAGSPAVPTDMSPMSRKRSVAGGLFAAAKDSGILKMLTDPLYKEVVKGKRLENEEHEEDITTKRVNNIYQKFLNSDNYTVEDIDKALDGPLPPQQRKYLLSLRSDVAVLKKLDNDAAISIFDRVIKTETYLDTIDKIKSEADISRDQAEVLLQTQMARILGIEAEEAAKVANKNIAEYNETMKEVTYWIDQGVKIGTVFKDVFEFLTFMRQFASPKAVKKAEKAFDKMKKTGDNTYEWY